MDITDKSLLDFQKEWEKLVDKANYDYGSLSAGERIWFNIEILISSVDNGGLINHYYNSGADRNAETIEDLQTLGFPNICDLLNKINSWFPNGYPSRDIQERNKVILNWQEGEYDELLELYDKELCSIEKDIQRKLIQHIETQVLTK